MCKSSRNCFFRFVDEKVALFFYGQALCLPDNSVGNRILCIGIEFGAMRQFMPPTVESTLKSVVVVVVVFN